ncbi:hypothetical protein BO70DRAFT_163551 [Aspergillus heteromorphus CBS 117.55]|uniref:Uncharacterized protein n=1 Tax=Aspergillus heteromorphus CBS 117.55 TaxID=1448321 RepID=A0A317WS17_9EURO|nr:uncharacterized protein BO70DRAFT_163551 [Aspergillus heteromorphus CBS 117.55]PWY89246.1 hypothetical protein BO70DRAFT_163551 [Aspergillus heteromorphus CBS 117.55]
MQQHLEWASIRGHYFTYGNRSLGRGFWKNRTDITGPCRSPAPRRLQTAIVRPTGGEDISRTARPWNVSNLDLTITAFLLLIDGHTFLEVCRHSGTQGSGAFVSSSFEGGREVVGRLQQRHRHHRSSTSPPSPPAQPATPWYIRLASQ